MITATFTCVKQSIALGCFPRLKIIHTSKKFIGQIYIPVLNWFLLVVCLIIVKYSYKSIPCFVVYREDHGHHEHESYYGDRDTDSIVKGLQTCLVALLSRWFQRARDAYLKVPFVGPISYLTLEVSPFCIVFAVYLDCSFVWIGQDVLVRNRILCI